MRIAECIVCWTPDRPEYQAGMRGKARVFPAHTPRADTAPFACWGGHVHADAHDPRLAVRHAYVLRLAGTMTHQDGLTPESVHQLLGEVEEYRSMCCDELSIRRVACARAAA
jgi:hypothetical protein